MKYNREWTKIKKIAVASILFICLCPISALAKDTLIVGWYDWAPHQMLDAKGNLSGINIELMKAISQKAGFKVEFKNIPWKRNLEELESGTVDVAMSASKTEEREKIAYFSDTYFKLEYNVMFVRKKDREKYSAIKTLKNIIGSDFKVGTMLGSIYSDEHEALLKNKEFMKNVQEVNSSNLNVGKLIKGRIDGFIEDELSGASLVKEAGYENEVDILFYLYSKEDASSYLMFSKKSMTKEQVERMNSALKAMKADGSYKKLLNKYELKKM